MDYTIVILLLQPKNLSQSNEQTNNIVDDDHYATIIH